LLRLLNIPISNFQILINLRFPNKFKILAGIEKHFDDYDEKGEQIPTQNPIPKPNPKTPI